MPLTFPFIFLGRRLILLLLIFGNQIHTQFISFGVMQVLLICYCSFVQPFRGVWENRTEMIKETFFLQFTYFIPIFTDYVTNLRVKYNSGSVMTILFLSMVSLSVIVTIFFSLLRIKILLKYLLWNKAGKNGKQVIISIDLKLKRLKDGNKEN